MSQDSILKLLEKHPEGLTITEMHKILGGSRGPVGGSVKRLRECGEIIICRYKGNKGIRAAVYILR